MRPESSGGAGVDGGEVFVSVVLALELGEGVSVGVADGVGKGVTASAAPGVACGVASASVVAAEGDGDGDAGGDDVGDVYSSKSWRGARQLSCTRDMQSGASKKSAMTQTSPSTQSSWLLQKKSAVGSQTQSLASLQAGGSIRGLRQIRPGWQSSSMIHGSQVRPPSICWKARGAELMNLRDKQVATESTVESELSIQSSPRPHSAEEVHSVCSAHMQGTLGWSGQASSGEDTSWQTRGVMHSELDVQGSRV